ncbi:MAG: sel1 repeat family protein [Tannerellaceae bacterium]|jgi:TPR repeat protein|nr:sel1 repeat family protein [Tannerellaceae bacterium]
MVIITKSKVLCLICVFLIATNLICAQSASELAKMEEQLEEGADLLDASMQYSMGVHYYFGNGGLRQNYQTAAKWFRRSAEKGHAIAQNILGTMYGQGQGVDQDYFEAEKWLRKSAEQGNAEAQSNLGRMYHNGEGVSQDYQEAAKWLLKSAEQGYAIAQCNLGVMYYEGKGVPQDYLEAIKWLRRSAQQGYEKAIGALNALGETY